MTVNDKLERMRKESAVVLVGVEKLQERVKITKFRVDIRIQDFMNMW
jgi:hypothetical protein